MAEEFPNKDTYLSRFLMWWKTPCVPFSIYVINYIEFCIFQAWKQFISSFRAYSLHFYLTLFKYGIEIHIWVLWKVIFPLLFGNIIIWDEDIWFFFFFQTCDKGAGSQVNIAGNPKSLINSSRLPPMPTLVSSPQFSGMPRLTMSPQLTGGISQKIKLVRNPDGKIRVQAPPLPPLKRATPAPNIIKPNGSFGGGQSLLIRPKLPSPPQKNVPIFVHNIQPISTNRMASMSPNQPASGELLNLPVNVVNHIKGQQAVTLSTPNGNFSLPPTCFKQGNTTYKILLPMNTFHQSIIQKTNETQKQAIATVVPRLPQNVVTSKRAKRVQPTEQHIDLTDDDDDVCFLEKLNVGTDCLVQIFQYLSLGDKMRLVLS